MGQNPGPAPLFQLRCTFTKDDWFMATLRTLENSGLLDHTIRRSQRTTTLSGVVFTVFMAVYAYVRAGRQSGTPATAVLVSVAISLVVSAAYYLIFSSRRAMMARLHKNLRRSINADPSMGAAESRITIDAESIHEQRGVTTTSFLWRTARRAAVSEEEMLLTFEAGLFRFPWRIFTTPEKRQRFVDIVADRLQVAGCSLEPAPPMKRLG